MHDVPRLRCLEKHSEKPVDCIFCHVGAENGFQVVWEDECFTVFRDHNPAAAHHLQVIPKKHIDNVKSLTNADIELLKHMKAIGHRVLQDLGVPTSERRLGFHIPPFCSVQHLHMHTLGLPFRSQFLRLKYPTVFGGRGFQKGFSWFCEIDQAIRILENGGTVGVYRC